MERRLLKGIFAFGLAATLAFTSVPFISGINGKIKAEADDTTTSSNTVKVNYNVQINQTQNSIQPVFNLVKEVYGSSTTTSDGQTDTESTANSDGVSSSTIEYNSALEHAAIQRAEDLVIYYDSSDYLRPDGTAGETVLDYNLKVNGNDISYIDDNNGTNKKASEGVDKTQISILTYSGTSAPDETWLKNQIRPSFTVKSVAIGHVTSEDNSKECYCIILTSYNYKDKGTIGTSQTKFVSPVYNWLSYNHIDKVWVSYSDDGTNYYDPIDFKAGNGSYNAALPNKTVAVNGNVSLPKIKYQVSTKTSDSKKFDIADSISGSFISGDANSGINYSGSLISGNVKVTGINKGSYSLIYQAQAAGRNTLLTVPLTVSTADISGADIEFTDKTKIYYANGTAAEPTVSVTLNGKTLQKNTDYTVSYENNTPATSVTTNQTATVTVTGIGNYKGSAKSSFIIYPANGGSLASATITVNEKNITYDGKEKKPKITVTLQGVTVPESSYSVKYANNIKAGTANIIVTAKNGDQRYTGVAKGTFSIAQADLASADFTFSDSDNKSNTNPQYSYTGADIKPEPGIKVGSETLTKDTDFTYSYSNNRAIGTTATVTITGKGNYTGTAFAYFEITKGNISKVTVMPTPSTFTYNGQRQYPAVVVVSIGTHQLIQGTDYTLSAYPNSVDAGTYNFTVTGINNFKGTTTSTTSTSTTTSTTSTTSGSTTTGIGTITGSYTINAKNVNDLYKKTNGISVSSVSTKTYTGKAIKPSITVTDDALGTVLSSSTDYTRTDSDNTNPGTAKISLEFKGNYTGTITISYKILPKKTTVKKVTAGKKKATVTYSKISGVTGYQVKCGTNRVVTKSTKTKNTTKTKYTMKSLKKGKRYYFKVRTYYTTSSGTKVYSSWSNVKSAKVK